jgi:hypothetical protein
MRIICVVALAFTMSALGWTRIADAQTAPTGTNAPAIAPPDVSEQADRLLRQMSDYLGSADQFTFHADINFDHVLPSGQKLQYAAVEDVALERPGRLYVEWHSDLGDRQFWYDGKSVTLYDPAAPFYAAEAAPPEIDSMLDELVPKLDFAPPLTDFLYHDPYRSVSGRLRYGIYLGLNDVDGRSCHTLAFVEKDIDWQIWIDSGPPSRNSVRSSAIGTLPPASPNPFSHRSCRRGQRRSRSRQSSPIRIRNSNLGECRCLCGFGAGTSWPAWPSPPRH